MSYSFFLAVFHYLSGEHYQLSQLSHASWLQGDHGKYVTVLMFAFSLGAVSGSYYYLWTVLLSLTVGSLLVCFANQIVVMSPALQVPLQVKYHPKHVCRFYLFYFQSLAFATFVNRRLLFAVSMHCFVALVNVTSPLSSMSIPAPVALFITSHSFFTWFMSCKGGFAITICIETPFLHLHRHNMINFHFYFATWPFEILFEKIHVYVQNKIFCFLVSNDAR